jgi:hypothetical protein
MAIQFFIEKYRQPFTGRTFTGVCKFTVPSDCTVTKLNFHAPTIAGTGWKFCVRKNGSAITPSDPSDPAVVSLGTGATDVSKTGLSIAAVAGDVIQVDLIAFGSGTWTGFEFCLIANDHVGGTLDELSDVDLSGNAAGDVLVFNGTLWVPAPLPAIPSTLNDLSDVNTAGETNGQFLKYNGSGWVPAAVPTPPATLNDLTDVDTAGEANGNFLKFNGTNWIPANVTVPANLDDLGDVVVTTPANGDVIKYDGSHFVNTPAASNTLAGDVTGTLGAAVVQKIQQRPVEAWALPTFVGDDFDDNSFDSTIWDVFKSSDASFAESTQRLNITPGSNTGFNKSAGFVYKQTFDAYSKEIIALINIVGPTSSNSGQGLDLQLGIVPAATAGNGSSGNLFDGFCGLKTSVFLQPFNNGLQNVKFFSKSGDTGDISTTSGSTTGVTQPTRAITDPWPIALRVKFDGQFMKGYVMDFGSSTWTQIFAHAFSSTSIPGMRLAFGMQTTSPNTIGQRASFESVTSTVTLTDVLTDGDSLAWNAAGQKWTNRAVNGLVRTTSGAPGSAPSGLPAGYTELRYDQSAHTLYAWNGSTWDAQVF